jgi:hypothetical protein
MVRVEAARRRLAQHHLRCPPRLEVGKLVAGRREEVGGPLVLDDAGVIVQGHPDRARRRGPALQVEDAPGGVVMDGGVLSPQAGQADNVLRS